MAAGQSRSWQIETGCETIYYASESYILHTLFMIFQSYYVSMRLLHNAYWGFGRHATSLQIMPQIQALIALATRQSGQAIF
jgi:hypothetical protein